MDILRVAAATLNQTPMDWSGNLRRIVAKIEEAKNAQAQILLLPELCISGYGCEDMFFSLHTSQRSERCLLEILEHTEAIVVVVGLPYYHRGSMYNCAAVLRDKKILGLNPKKVLPREGVHYEPRWFEAWRFGVKEEVMLAGQLISFGDLRYQFGDFSLGVEICEEAWDSEGAAAMHAIMGCELIVNPSASHFALGKFAARETLVADASRSMRVHYLYTNLVGLEAGRIVYDGGVLLGEVGKISARRCRFGFGDGEIFVADLDLDQARVAKMRFRSLKHWSLEQTADLVVRSGNLARVEPKTPNIEDSSLSHSDGVLIAYEEFLWAQMLALIDYLRKTSSKGFVISLSGGSDSSAVSVLVAHAIAELYKKMGSEKMAEYLACPKPVEDSPRAWIKELVTLVYQSSKHSGDVTKTAARALAEELGASFHEVSIEGLVEHYEGLCESVIGRELSWKTDDIARQNIQARARSPFVWMLANIKSALLLSTSNRSEAAVGYATMDGDTSGGLSPIAGIDKVFLREWLVWAQKDCPWGLGPISSLEKVNAQQPTAELRPSSESQTDEADLMPYELLDVIERSLVRDRMGPESILATLMKRFPNLPRQKLEQYLSKFLRLWSYNQWKRERLAPSFHLDDESLDPKTWCRFPILSGAFKDELKELPNWQNPIDP